MAETTEPFDGGPYMYESGWSTLFSMAMTNGVSSRADNGLQVYSDNDGRQIKLTAGLAHVRGHLYKSTDVIVRPIDPNSSGNPRIDRVVLRLNTSGKSATPFVIPGTPSGSPSPPPILQVPGGIWDVPLANVRVENSFTSITSDKISDVRPYVGPPTSTVIWKDEVDATETTASTSPTSLSTFGPSVNVVVPQSGIVKVSFGANVTPSAGQYGVVYFATTGANTIAASNKAISVNFGAGNGSISAENSYLLTGLNPGPTLFLLQYASTGGFSAQFSYRRIIVEAYP